MAIASETLLDRMVSAEEKVRQRLLRATGALSGAGVDYAVVGGNAVAAWVASVDPADSTWPARLPAELSARLQQLLDTPDN